MKKLSQQIFLIFLAFMLFPLISCERANVARSSLDQPSEGDPGGELSGNSFNISDEEKDLDLDGVLDLDEEAFCLDTDPADGPVNGMGCSLFQLCPDENYETYSDEEECLAHAHFHFFLEEILKDRGDWPQVKNRHSLEEWAGLDSHFCNGVHE